MSESITRRLRRITRLAIVFFRRIDRSEPSQRKAPAWKGVKNEIHRVKPAVYWGTERFNPRDDLFQVNGEDLSAFLDLFDAERIFTPFEKTKNLFDHRTHKETHR